MISMDIKMLMTLNTALNILKELNSTKMFGKYTIKNPKLNIRIPLSIIKDFMGLPTLNLFGIKIIANQKIQKIDLSVIFTFSYYLRLINYYKKIVILD